MRCLRIAVLVAICLPASRVSSAGAGGGKVVRRSKVAGLGRDVRLRTPYRPGRSPLGPGALMKSPALVSEKNYQDVKAYSKEILTRFPPDRFYYVGVGRTPGPIIAMLKNLGPDLAMNFPVSAMRVDGAKAFRRFAANYTAHIEILIPEEVRRGDRRLLLIDYTSGRSLRGLRDALGAYRAAGGQLPAADLLTVGITPGDTDLSSISLGHEVEFWTEPEAVAEFLGEGHDKGHIIHTDDGTLDNLSHNPRYTEHRWALYQRMARDPELDAFLRARFPTLVRPRK
jgi:hypothetical protein